MLVWQGLSEIDPELGPTVVTIGNFDGVHRGHRHVIQKAHELAAQCGAVPVVAVSFDPHPLRVVAPSRVPEALTSLERRIELLAGAGADAVLVLPFTPELAQMSAEVFVTKILLEALQARGVVVGENFRYGRDARRGRRALEAAVRQPRCRCSWPPARRVRRTAVVINLRAVLRCCWRG